MSTQALFEGFRGSSQDPGVTVHFDQVWFDQLSLEALLVDGNIVRYRARSHDGVQSWLVAVPADAPLDAVSRRLQREFVLAGKLDSAWAVRPLALIRLSRGPVLVYEDNGGALIFPPVDSTLAIGRFLRIAIGAARRQARCAEEHIEGVGGGCRHGADAMHVLAWVGCAGRGKGGHG